MSQLVGLKLRGLMVERTKVTPIYESNPPNSEENPTYVASRQVGVIVEELPDEPEKEIPRYVVSQEEQGTGGSTSNHNPPS